MWFVQGQGHRRALALVSLFIFLLSVEVAEDVFDYIEMFYNPVRRHGSAGDLSPIEFERRYALTARECL
ncbi:IS3 family transposase [Burkholderia gladioli]|nr:IS3 family transposase [Burkholderia gladioli]